MGLHWEPNLDKFFFKLKFHKVKQEVIMGQEIPTKRELLQLTMSIFDPLGFVANITVYGKIILQDLWKIKLGWDEKLPENFQDKWHRWRRIIQKIELLQINRCYSQTLTAKSEIQLHIFCDASEKAYASVVFLRIKKDNCVTIAFIMAKTKVAPLKVLSIPRLELQAALLASKLSKFIKENHPLKFSKIFLWSDSKTILYWLNSDLFRFKQYVANRVGEIRELTDINSWRWNEFEE